MKKSLILTSVLALAACGGGSGGGHHSTVATSNGADEFARSGFISDTAKTSNEEVTSMASAVVVAKDGSGNAVVRSAKTFNGKEYEVYSLENVKLYAAEAAHSGDGYLQLGMDDNGRIDRVKMVVSGVGGDIDRVGESNQFKGPIYEYVIDEVHEVTGQDLSTADLRDTYRSSHHWDDDGRWVNVGGGNWNYIEYGDNAVVRVADTGQTKEQLEAKYQNLTGGHWNRITEVMDVVTYGKDIGNGKSLQYADFGHFNPVYTTKQLEMQNDGTYAKTKIHSDAEIEKELSEQDYQLFAGGYAIKGTSMAADRPSLDPVKGTSYKGMAIGRVRVSMDGGAGDKATKLAYWNVPFDKDTNADGVNDAYTENAGHDISKLYTTKEATMIIGADGKQTLYMPFNSHSDNNTDKFYDVTLVKNADGTMANPVFEGTLSDLQYRRNDTENNIEGEFHPGYYGVNTPSEAAGTARYYTKQKDGSGDTAFKREWEVQAAYGMKKQ